jgi:hypothetical protein
MPACGCGNPLLGVGRRGRHGRRPGPGTAVRLLATRGQEELSCSGTDCTGVLKAVAAVRTSVKRKIRSKLGFGRLAKKKNMDDGEDCAAKGLEHAMQQCLDSSAGFCEAAGSFSSVHPPLPATPFPGHARCRVCAPCGGLAGRVPAGLNSMHSTRGVGEYMHRRPGVRACAHPLTSVTPLCCAGR